ncbi:MAG: hypothetical protein HY434_01570 [Candidatus Liptonbacteria bacterium]|nr:hypothetical protein [Candidatus Liptonbacteria bacterium]
MRLRVILGIVALGAIFFLVFVPRVVIIAPVELAKVAVKSAASVLPGIPEAIVPESKQGQSKISGTSDLPNQPPLANPPDVAKGIYVTGWSAGSQSRISSLIALVKRTEVNAMVVDIKDYSGNVSYRTGLPEVVAAGAEGEIRVAQPNALIKRLHDEHIYIIGRITVFQDPILAKAHPEWALQNKVTGKTWTDSKKLSWMDAAAKPVWDYTIAIAKDAFARGFDEIQFDYVRFASDGALGEIDYPFWDAKTPRHKVIAEFFKYLRDSLPGKKISADLFGLAAVDTWDDLGIGQVIEDAYKNFDYVSPMVYPSHFAAGTLGYKSPAQHPYEIVKYSMEQALARLAKSKEQRANSSSTIIITTSSDQFAIGPLPFAAKLRPWLQDFNLGATYNAEMVRKQIQATYDVFLNGTSSDPSRFGGWILWDPANTYTEGALERG